MTIVNSAAADAFIQRLPKEILFYLVHGLDEGLTHERVKAIIRGRIGDDSDPMRLVRLEGDAVARDPGILADEAYAISMFGGDRAIWIDAQGRDLLPALEPLFTRPPTDCTLVVKAGQLKKGTALRAAFESSAARASIECYSDDASTLEALINAEARAAGLAIVPDARAALVHMVGADRRTTRARLSSPFSPPPAERRAARSRNSCSMRKASPKSPLKMSRRSSRTPPRPTSTTSSTMRCSATCLPSRRQQPGSSTTGAMRTI
jgi:DNA polymerase-3 subunit delta